MILCFKHRQKFIIIITIIIIIIIIIKSLELYSFEIWSESLKVSDKFKEFLLGGSYSKGS